MKSPLYEARRLLHFYRWIGALPAHIGDDADTFSTSLAFYLPLGLAFLVFAAPAAVMFSLSAADSCFFPMAWQSFRNGDMTRLESFVNNFDSFAKLLFLVSTVILHHSCINRYSDLVRLFDLKSDYYFSCKKPLRQHAFLVGLSVVSGTLLCLATIFAFDPDWNCPDSIVLSFLMDGVFVYTTMMTCVPELIYSSFAHSLSRGVKSSVDRLQTDRDIGMFCQRQKHHYKITREMEDIFGRILFSSYAHNVIILVTSSYLTVVNFMQLYWDNAVASYTSASSSLVLAIISGARVIHLTDVTQCIFDKFGSAVDALNLTDDAPAAFSSPDARQARALLDRADGVALRGFFVVNRGILLAILSNLLTYLIVLIEFEIDDQEEEDREGQCCIPCVQ